MISKIKDEVWYLGAYENLGNMVLQKFRLSNKEDIEDLKNTFHPILSKKDPSSISPSSQRRYFLCWALYNQLIGNYDEVFQYSEKVIDWWDKHPLNKEEEFHKYIVD